MWDLKTFDGRHLGNRFVLWQDGSTEPIFQNLSLFRTRGNRCMKVAPIQISYWHKFLLVNSVPNRISNPSSNPLFGKIFWHFCFF